MALRFTTAGESHGPGLTAVLEGLPAGLELRPEDIDRDLARRQLGHGRGGRMKIETDRAEVTSGVRHGRTLGSPVALRIQNRDYANWEERMNPWPVDGRGGGGPPAAARPRRPRRRAEVRLHATSATCSSARARARRRRAWPAARSPRRSCARSASRCAQPRAADRLGRGAGAATTWRRRTSRPSTSRRCAASTRTASAAMVEEINARAEGERVARRHLRGARVRR